MTLDFSSFTYVTFDCYGTLIDWERGILTAVRPAFERHGVTVDDGTILELFARHEAEEESGEYQRYRDVLRNVLAKMAVDLGFAATESDRDSLVNSVGNWPPFPDTTGALRRLQTRYKLAIISNVDEATFAGTASLLQTKFDEVITAEQVGSYKPNPENFRFALAKLGVDRSQVLHVAQSIYHDHAPAKELGFSTVWVNRRSARPGTGVAPSAKATPDLEVPDLHSLVRLMDLDVT